MPVIQRQPLRTKGDALIVGRRQAIAVTRAVLEQLQADSYLWLAAENGPVGSASATEVVAEETMHCSTSLSSPMPAW